MEAPNEAWLQMQADIFNATIVKLESEQGPAMGAAMLAAYGSGWFPSMQECAGRHLFVRRSPTYRTRTQWQFTMGCFYQEVYGQTRGLNDRLAHTVKTDWRSRSIPYPGTNDISNNSYKRSIRKAFALASAFFLLAQ